MKALILDNPNRLSLRTGMKEETSPEEPYARVRIRYVSLCGSDYRLYRGDYSGPNDYPIIPGHEWIGQIETVNGKSDCFFPGEWVTGDCSGWGISCSQIDQCTFENKNLCPKLEKYGITQNGFLREFAYVPLRHLYRLPQEAPHRQFAVTELFAVAINGIKRGLHLSSHSQTGRCVQDQKKKTLIIGAGALGVAAALYLSLEKKQDVALYEENEEKRHWLQPLFPELQFLEYIGQEGEKYRELLTRTHYELVLEASGSAGGIETALAAADPGGVVLLYGMYPPSQVSMKTVVCKGLLLSGSIGGTGSFPEAIRFLRANVQTVGRMITEQIPFEQHAVEKELQKSNIKRLKTIIAL